MQNTPTTLSRTLHNKLQSLVSFLGQVTRNFNMIAEEIDNVGLSSAVRSVAIEAKQYIKEISNQFQHFETGLAADTTDPLWKQIEGNLSKETNPERGGEIIALCNNCETYFNKLYADILQESLPTQNSKDIISFQLYAINCALMKIKLLNTTRFNQQLV